MVPRCPLSMTVAALIYELQLQIAYLLLQSESLQQHTCNLKLTYFGFMAATKTGSSFVAEKSTLQLQNCLPYFAGTKWLQLLKNRLQVLTPKLFLQLLICDKVWSRKNKRKFCQCKMDFVTTKNVSVFVVQLQK